MFDVIIIDTSTIYIEDIFQRSIVLIADGFIVVGDGSDRSLKCIVQWMSYALSNTSLNKNENTMYMVKNKISPEDMNIFDPSYFVIPADERY